MILTTQNYFKWLSPLIGADVLFYLPIEMEILNEEGEQLISLVKEGMQLA